MIEGKERRKRRTVCSLFIFVRVIMLLIMHVDINFFVGERWRCLSEICAPRQLE